VRRLMREQQYNHVSTVLDLAGHERVSIGFVTADA
jgi:hypothetical protein